ncbi:MULTISPECIES: hypothetical protein [Actinomycetes]|uniref:hypothetical protein n=1 Tax=Micromonospora sp. NPDC005367 TaxID=3155590 RepID=UPI0033A4E8DF
MRLRILELPTEKLGPAVQTPFCLVFDNATRDECDVIGAQTASLRETTGARGILAFDTAVDLPGANSGPGVSLDTATYGFSQNIHSRAEATERAQRRRIIAQAGPFSEALEGEDD